MRANDHQCLETTALLAWVVVFSLECTSFPPSWHQVRHSPDHGSSITRSITWLQWVLDGFFDPVSNKYCKSELHHLQTPIMIRVNSISDLWWGNRRLEPSGMLSITPPQAWSGEYKWRTKLGSEQYWTWTRSTTVPTPALKPTDPPLVSAPMPYTTILPCVSLEPGAQHPNRLRLIQPVLHTRYEKIQPGGWLVNFWSASPSILLEVSSKDSRVLAQPRLITIWPLLQQSLHGQEYTSCVGSEQHGQNLLLCLDLMMDREQHFCTWNITQTPARIRPHTLGSALDNSPSLIPMFLRKNAMDRRI